MGPQLGLDQGNVRVGQWHQGPPGTADTLWPHDAGPAPPGGTMTVSRLHLKHSQRPGFQSAQLAVFSRVFSRSDKNLLYLPFPKIKP